MNLACLFSIVSEMQSVFNKIQKNNCFFAESCANLYGNTPILAELLEKEENIWVLPHLL